MIETDRFEAVELDSAEALEAWLAAHHGRADSVWLVTYRKHMGPRYLSREAVLDALIAWGWIDGIRRKLDDDRTMQLIGPRRQQAWAQSYRQRVARLTAEGLMREPGLRAVAAAKQAGTWEANLDVDALEVPADLAAALADRPLAAGTFAADPPSYRRNVLRWIAGARRLETRARRIQAVADHAARGARVPQF